MAFLNGEPLESSGTFLSRFCIQLMIILVLPRVLHFFLLQRILQPRVFSEIISGIILGPSCLGQIESFHDNVFPPRSLPYLQALGQLGVFIYMFMTGCMLDIDKLWECKVMALFSTALSAGLAFALAPGIKAAIYSNPTYTALDGTQFTILMAIILTLSSAAFLARVLSERGLLTSNLGSLCMSAATMQVFYSFILLAAVIAMYGSQPPPCTPCDAPGPPRDGREGGRL